MNAKNYISPEQLVERWEGIVTYATLATWRARNHGPAYIKLGGKVAYLRESVERYERENIYLHEMEDDEFPDIVNEAGGIPTYNEQEFLQDFWPDLHRVVMRETGENPRFIVPDGSRPREGYVPSYIKLAFNPRADGDAFRANLAKRLRAYFSKTDFVIKFLDGNE
ncbi:hypothetical protein [Aquabacterium sp.]|uniref:hypothetical protein n=1 Tax=Aquabacterium sp. TaxID=1872578 RepID=UPI003BB1F335